MNLHEAHEILTDTDRQHIIYELIENDGFSTISDLSQQIASCSDIPEESDKTIEDVKIRLIHNHLPRLEDHGIVEYDTRSGDVVLTDVERSKSLLNTTEELETVIAGLA